MNAFDVRDILVTLEIPFLKEHLLLYATFIVIVFRAFDLYQVIR